MSEDRSTTATALLAFTGGAVLGAGLALLFAPQSGRKTRKQLNDLAEDAAEKIQDLGDEAAHSLEKARARGEHWVGQAKEFVDEKKNQAAALLDNARR